MKIRSMLIFTLFVLFLSSCAGFAPEVAPTVIPTRTSTVTPQPVRTQTTALPSTTLSPEVLAYLDEMVPILDDISQTSEEMDDLFFLAAARSQYLTNEDWLKLANDRLDALLEGADKIDAIEPVPAEAESAHEYFQLAADELRLVVMSQYEVIDGNFDSAFDVTEHMQQHLNLIGQAFGEIDKLQQ